jgi:dolichol-phosphate mannosyltransferase
MTSPLVSIVAPALNEAANLESLHDRLASVFASLDCGWELIVVDDGSTDATSEVVRALHARAPRVKALCLSRSFGQSAAISAGVEVARGDAVVVMDADGQDPPELIPAMIAKWREGFRVVVGRRVLRTGEPLLKRLTAFVFYRVMKGLVGWEFPVDTGEFRLLDRSVVEAVRACPQRDRLFRVLAAWPGFTAAAVDYEHGARHAGSSNYTMWKSALLAVTAITGFSALPLCVAAWLGCGIVIATLMLSGLLALKALSGSPIQWVYWAVISLWFLGGVQCIFLGVLGEYVGRIHTEVQQRPLYVVLEAIGFDQESDVTKKSE